MHIHDVVTHYHNYAFLCACHVNSTVFFALPPCCVVESYSRVCVLVDDHTIFYFNHRRDSHFALLFPPMCESVSLVLLSHV